MSVYLPSMVLQKALGMARVILFTYLVSSYEMGIWGTGVMMLILGGAVVTLGTHHGMGRYVSLYESRGQLRAFFKRVWLLVLLIVILVTAVSFLFSEQILKWILLPRLHGQVADSYQWRICFAALANVGMMGVHLNMISFMYGLRVYRVVSVVEIFFSLVFTGLGLSMVCFDATALMILYAHLGALILTFVFGMTLLWGAVWRISADSDLVDHSLPRENFAMLSEADADSVVSTITVRDTDTLEKPGQHRRVEMMQFLRFGFVGMIGSLIWLGGGYVSYFMVLRELGESSAGIFHVMMKLAQPLLFLASAAWAVIFSHVAKRWESNDREGAIYTFETAFKAITLVVMTLTVILYIAAPIWIRVLQVEYRQGYYCLPGLLTFFMAVSNLTVLGIPAKLHERPIVIAIAGLAGGGLNAILAMLWMPELGIVGAARAAGVGMYFGGGLVMLVYLLASKTRLHDSTYFLFATPALLLLPSYVAGAVWGIILPLCIFSSWFFDDNQKKLLHHSANKMLAPFHWLRRKLTWR
jgi:O-antigen/teichoic acid export membrane protein